MPKSRSSAACGDPAGVRRSPARVERATARRSARWIVTGTTRSSAQASIITGVARRRPARRDTRCGRDGGSRRDRALSLLIGLVTSAAARPPRTSATAASIAPITAGASAGSGWPGSARGEAAERQHRQRVGEDRGAPRRARRSARTGTCQPSRAASAREPLRDRRSRRRAARPRVAPQPRLERDLAADPGGLAHRQGERQRHASHPDVDIGGAAQIAQVAARQRVEPLAQQCCRRPRRGSARPASASLFAAHHDHADAVLLQDRLRRPGRPSARRTSCASPARSGSAADLPSLDSCGALSLPIRSMSSQFLALGPARSAPRRALRAAPASLGAGRQRKDDLHDVVARCRLLARRCRRCGGRAPAAGNSRRRCGSAATARPAVMLGDRLGERRAAAGPGAPSRYRRRPPPSAIARIAGRPRRTARPASSGRSAARPARGPRRPALGLSTARKISATRLCGSSVVLLEPLQRVVDLVVGDRIVSAAMLAHQLGPDDRRRDLVDERAAVDAVRLREPR